MQFATQADLQVMLAAASVSNLTTPGVKGTLPVGAALTTLLDEEMHAALDLIELYHARWEEELCIDEIKTQQGERPVLRSQTPCGVVQELYRVVVIAVALFDFAEIELCPSVQQRMVVLRKFGGCRNVGSCEG